MKTIQIDNKTYFTDSGLLYYKLSYTSYYGKPKIRYNEVRKCLDGVYSEKQRKILKDLTQSNS